MAPIKQSLLPLGMFVKTPKLSTKKKHAKLERKSLGLPATRKKPYVDKKREQRIKDEKVTADGAEGWRRHLERAGDTDANIFRTDIMFEAYGPAPDPETGNLHAFQDENHIDFPDETKSCDDASM
jgi:hypothetical protein